MKFMAYPYKAKMKAILSLLKIPISSCNWNIMQFVLFCLPTFTLTRGIMKIPNLWQIQGLHKHGYDRKLSNIWRFSGITWKGSKISQTILKFCLNFNFQSIFPKTLQTPALFKAETRRCGVNVMPRPRFRFRCNDVHAQSTGPQGDLKPSFRIISYWRYFSLLPQRLTIGVIWLPKNFLGFFW